MRLDIRSLALAVLLVLGAGLLSSACVALVQDIVGIQDLIPTAFWGVCWRFFASGACFGAAWPLAFGAARA